ncbi:MAG TPA: ATP-grasp domain-containing protein [Solirubrobacteraceae bacterium]
MRALIIDSGLDRGSLAAARALAADGWTVGVGSPARGLAASSRAVAHWHPMPAPRDGTDDLIAAVSDAVRAQRYEVVFSSEDEGVLALSAGRGELSAVIPYGPHETVLRAFDKLQLTRAAESVGIGVPRTIEPTADALASWQGPVVVKPTFTFATQSEGRMNAIVLDDPSEAPARVQEIRRSGGRPILQEVVAGELCAISVLSDQRSRIVACTQQRAELTWPPRVGVSARARTVPLEPDLFERVRALIERLEWFGLAQLQFLVAADSDARLLDFNGRFYGSLALAIAAGVDFPTLWARLATERPLPPISQPAIGRRYQWFSRDLRASLSRADTSRLGGALGSIAHAVGSTHSVWRMNDPWPAIHHYGGALLAQGLERVRPGR